MRALSERDRAYRHLLESGAISDFSSSGASIHSSDIDSISERVARLMPDVSPTEIDDMLRNARAVVNRRN